MALVTFTSDFGTCDHYVASVKAQILHALPQQPIVDISHQIPSCDVSAAAFILQEVYADFPKGTIHILAVNSAGAKQNRHVMVVQAGHFFIGPDNGVFALLFAGQKPKIFEIACNQEVSTFPARTVYGPTAVNLLHGKLPEELGRQIDGFYELLPRLPIVEADRIKGAVVHVDQTGNLITNISRQLFEGSQQGRNFTVKFEYEKVYQIVENYNSVDFGDCVVLFNSSGWLEIAINQGHAGELLGMSRNSPVVVRFSPDEAAIPTRKSPAAGQEAK